MIASLIILCLVYAFADRFSGGGWPWEKLSLRGRPLWYAGPVAGLLTTLVAGWQIGLITSLTLMLWRGPGWRIGNRGGIAPQSGVDIAALALRHTLAGVFIPLAVWAGLDPYKAAYGVLGFIFGSTLIGAAYGASVRRGNDIGPWTEIVRGALMGAMFWSVLA